MGDNDSLVLEKSRQDTLEDAVRNINQKKDSAAHIDDDQFVVFKVADEYFGVNISEVTEIIKLSSITRVPNCENSIEGVINLRGRIVIVFNLARKLNLKQKEYEDNTRIIIIENSGKLFGIIVDSVDEVLRIRKDDLNKAPSMITQKIDKNYLKSVAIIGERLVIIIDLSKI